MENTVNPFEFVGWPKISRFSRDVILTEKIDGTCSLVKIFLRNELTAQDLIEFSAKTAYWETVRDGIEYVILAGSRNKWIDTQNDNAGFARWVGQNQYDLVTLGPGSHFGEWWGSGIQRGYGLPKGEKRFSLFNVSRWCENTPQGEQTQAPPCCRVVPVLYRGPFDTLKIDSALEDLRLFGSLAQPGFMKPEGVVIFHTASGHLYKKTIEKDDTPKSKV